MTGSGAANGHDDAGFTLIEVLVAIVIQGLIMSALCSAFVGILRGSSQVSQSLSRSGDARIVAHYVASDAAQFRVGRRCRSSTRPRVPSPPVAGAATPVARFKWDSTSASATTTANIVNYVLVGNVLLRRQCVAGTLLSDAAVATSVQSVSVVCAPTACGGSPTSIAVTITETPDSNGSVYVYTLDAAFRQLIGAGPPTVPSSLVALGGGSCTGGVATGVNVAGTAAMRVYGNVKVNAPDAAGSPACKAMSLGTSAGNYTAGGTQILTGGSCAASGSSTCPAYSAYSPAFADPYAGMAAPSTVGLPSRTGCPSGTALPGVYASTLTLSANCTFASGVYVLQNGLSITSGPTAISGAAGGVFFYLPGGTFAETGTATVNLTAMSSDTYAGVLMWRTGSTATPISNSGPLTLNGALYAPNAQMQFGGSAVATKATSIVSQSLALSAAATLSIGTAAPLSIPAPASLPAWTVNRPLYPNPTIIGAGGDGVAYIWSATNLPAGMSINASSGVISGKLTAAGTKSVTVTVGDKSGDDVANKVYSLTINVAPAIPTASLPNGEQTVAYSTSLAGSGGTTPYSWSVASGMPAGLSINASSGVISGTPTGIPGAATVAVTLTDAAGATVAKNLSLTIVSAVSITTSSLPAAEQTLLYSTTLAGSGGATPYSWSVTSGMPAGLSINASTGVISGTPTGSGTPTLAVRLADALGAIVTANLSLTITAQPAISSVTLANGTGTAGTLGKGDTIAIVFSRQMSETSMCSTWTGGDTANQTLNASSNVTVSIADGTSTTNDALTVTSTSCTFAFGSINLGSNAYASTAASFGGTSTNVSTITWTASTRKLAITLGAKISGTVANVLTSTPIHGVGIDQGHRRRRAQQLTVHRRGGQEVLNDVAGRDYRGSCNQRCAGSSCIASRRGVPTSAHR